MSNVSVFEKIATDLLRRLPRAASKVSRAQSGHRFYTGEPARARLSQLFSVVDPLFGVSLTASAELNLSTRLDFDGPKGNVVLRLYPPYSRGKPKIWYLPIVLNSASFRELVSSPQKLAEKFAAGLQSIYEAQIERMFLMLATGQPISSGLRNRLAALFKAKPAFLTKFRTDLASIIVNTQIASDQSQQAVDNPTISLSNDLSSKCQELLIGQLINFYEIHTFRNDLDKKKLLRLSKEGNVIINYKSNLESSKISIQIGDFKREYDIPREGSNCAPKNTTN